MEPEVMLLAVGEVVRSYDADAWIGLLQHAIAALNEWLGQEIETEPLNQGCVGEKAGGGFCLYVLKACPSRSHLLHWRGILGATIVDDRIRVSLTVFMYSGSERLVTKTGKEFADFFYEMNEDKRGEWRLVGWFEDTYGEYSQF